MFLFAYVLLSLLFYAPTYGAPLESRSHDLLRFPPVVHKGLLCGLPIPVIQNLLCPRKGSTSLTVSTPLGTAHGAADNADAVRFAVKYANANRWQPSSLVSSWQLPNGLSDPTALPLPCPQSGIDDSASSEDCLSMVLYVPKSVTVSSDVPILVWIHGGSFILGSASGPGLDGSNLATATNSIVAVIQYRLGVLGFFPPNGQTNLAVKDVVNALQFLKNIVPSFGGDESKITIAGQSAGASMIRTLLATPSASSLFQSAILQSDTMDYGMYSTGSQQSLQNYFNSQLSCSSSNTTCLNALAIDDILTAQQTLCNNAMSIDASAGQAEPIRPVHDGTLVTTTLDSTSPFPHVTKPVLVTTVKNEAGFTIYGGFGAPLAPTDYDGFVTSAFGQPSAGRLLANTNYAVVTTANATDGSSSVDARPQLEQMGTDQVWRCPSWTFARNWVSNGGKAFVGEYVVGASYPGNEGVSFCTQSGVVCHQDDIEIVFGTVPSPSSAQAALTTEMQARYSAFLRTGNPNKGSYSTWSQATSTDVQPIQLGGSDQAAVGACDPSFWGAAVPYDYQTFGI